METQKRYILRHKQRGLFIGTAPEEYHTKHISKARRFLDAEQIDIWLQVSAYAPEIPGEYEPVEIEIEYRLKESV